MNNRTLFYLTAIVLISMAALLTLNLSSILRGEPLTQDYIRRNHVRGMAVEHHQLLYTLNFQQQNDILDILNRAIRVTEIKGKREEPLIEKIVIYQFDNQPDLILKPIAYVNDDLVFSIPEWNPDGYLMEVSAGRLHQLLSQTYDP